MSLYRTNSPPPPEPDDIDEFMRPKSWFEHVLERAASGMARLFELPGALFRALYALGVLGELQDL